MFTRSKDIKARMNTNKKYFDKYLLIVLLKLRVSHKWPWGSSLSWLV